MVNSNANLRKIIAPKSNLMCNINLVNMNDNMSFETSSKSRIADKVPLCMPAKPLANKLQAEKCSSLSLTGPAKNSLRTTGMSTSSPNSNTGKRQQNQWKQLLPLRSSGGRKTIKSDRMTLDPVYQKHPFINIYRTTSSESSRDQQLKNVKLSLQNQLVQINRNRALNKLLLNAGSGSVCDIIRETQQKAHSDKQDKLNDLGQKTTSTWPKVAESVVTNLVQIADHSHVSPKKSTSTAQPISVTPRPKTSNPKKREKAFASENCGSTKRVKNNNNNSNNNNSNINRDKNATKEKDRESNITNQKKPLNCPNTDNLQVQSNDQIQTKEDHQLLTLFDEFKTGVDATSTTTSNSDLNCSKSLSFSNFADDIDINSLLSQLPIHSFDLLSNELITSSWPGTADYVI